MSQFGDPANDFADDPMFKKTRKHRYRAEPGECKYCDRMRVEDQEFHPAHDPSPNCQSSKRNHCTCDTCF